MRSRATATLVATLLCAAGVVAPHAVHAAPAGDDEVIAFEVRGVGNGHGRGLSQWGAYGRAIAGQSWQRIVRTYYGDTSAGTRSEPRLRVRLTRWDGAGRVGVISAPGRARWNGDTTSYSSIYATETAPNRFDVFAVTSGRGCPGALDLSIPRVDLQEGSLGGDVVDVQEFLTYFDFAPGGVDGVFGPMTAAAVRRFQVAGGLDQDGRWRIEEWDAAQALVDAEPGTVAWQPVATDVTGPIRFSTTVDQANASPGDVLGVCTASGTIGHYRGVIELRDTADGNRVIDEVDVENYLRGVLPKEVPASWGDAAGGKGMHALRAQAVAARSYGLAQSRYAYAGTCDTSSCQVYGGAASRISATTGNFLRVEHANTDRAIDDTAGSVRVRGGNVVSTEFSASNGPRTAGGAYPPVNDPFDDQPGNPNHRWTRIIDADLIRSRYGLASANDVRTAPDAASPYDGIWANEVRLGGGRSVSAWSFRNSFGLPAPGFELVPITRRLSAATSFALIGDSVAVRAAAGATSRFQVLTEGVFERARYDARTSRRTQGGTVPDGVAAARLVPEGTGLVVVELGYNDDPAAMAGRVDAVMEVLRDRGVGTVLWVGLAERRSTPYALANAALDAAADRWRELIVLDWQVHSSGTVADRWFDDGVHLTTTGDAEFTRWLRDRVVGFLADGYTPPRPIVPGTTMRVAATGVGGVPSDGVVGVALNVTAVDPVGPGFLRVWPCGSKQPGTSSVNWVSAGSVEPNAVVVPVDGTGEVCVSSLVETDVVVDVTGWFDAGLRAAVGRFVDTRRRGERVGAGEVFRVPVTGRYGVPSDGVVGVALNVTAVDPVGPGFLRVWPCGSKQPGTSSVNWVSAGSVEPNAVVVPVDGTGEVCVSSLVETDVVVDVTGWFDAGLRAAVGRFVDTRRRGERVGAGEVFRVPVTGRYGVPSDGVVGVALNVTAVDPVGPGFLRVWPCGSKQPGTSSVNWVSAGSVEPNAVVVPVDGTGEVCVSSLVETDVVVDVTAWFDAGLQASPGGRIVDTRDGTGPPAPR